MKTVYEIVQEYKDREFIKEYQKKTDKEAIDSFKHLSTCFKELADKLEELTMRNKIW